MDFKETIKDYLDKYVLEDELFKIKYENPDKNIDDCCQYIITEVHKKNKTAFTDEEIYYMARHYYIEEQVEIDKSVRSSKIVTPATKKKSAVNENQSSIFDFLGDK